ncbi:Serine/threonine-protein phosphatase 4 regulatory subunit 4 [Homalodisca vitripennis]|nr:Serine/threonine-protein phosphatase 4 regulatory subunit 4 [Homalodisca vitripennis]
MTCLGNFEMSNESGPVGDELQKISVMKNLPMLIKEDLTACMQRIIPRMQQTLPHGTTEYNMGACDAVRTVARQNLMSTDNFTKVFLQHILNSLESRDTVAADEWLNVLLDIIKVLPINVLHTEVLPIAVNKAHISKPVHVRVTSCRILGHLALSFSAAQVKRDIIPVVISLCQDVSGEVRAAMSKELPNLASTLGLETSNFLLNHLLDLVSDEEVLVREAAVEAVAYMLPKFPPDTRTGQWYTEDRVGDELQKISVMKNLPMLIKEDLTACMQRIIPRMQQTLPHGTTEYNMGACDAVRTVARQNLMSTDNFTKVFLQHILNSLESRDTVAADEWLNVLLDIIKVLPINVLHTEVLPIAVNKAHISKPVHVRVTSCRILGHLALSFSAAQVKRDIIPVVISLCQDVSGEVRAAMSKELPNLASTLGLETSNFLLNHLLDLVSDEEVLVREAAVEAVAYMLPKFPPDILKSTIIPLTKKVFPDIVKNEDGLLVVLTKVYGQYAVGLKNYMTVIEKSQFLQRYIQMSQLNSNTRRNKINPYNPSRYVLL